MGITEVKSKNDTFPVAMPSRNIENFDLISNNIEKNLFEATPFEFSVQFCEDLWAAIQLQGGKKLVVGCIHNSTSLYQIKE